MENSSSSSSNQDVMDSVPLFFKCPISMELMEDPVTVSTGVTYDRKNIEKWLFVYKKRTCPATMQSLKTFDLTPNTTLKRLISSLGSSSSATSSETDLASSSSPTTMTLTTNCSGELVSLLETIQSSLFKVNSLRKLRTAITGNEGVAAIVVKCGGIEVLSRIVAKMPVSGMDFVAFRACEEAVAVLRHLPLADDGKTNQLLTTPECLTSMTTILERGSSDARVNTVTIFQKITRTSKDWCQLIAEQSIEFYKSILDLLSDEVLITTRATSALMDILSEIMITSKRRRIRAIEAGAVSVLIELLPDAGRHKSEAMLLLLKLLCECPEGRSAVSEHGMGIAVISKKLIRVSDTATKLGLKILWLVCSFLPTERVIDEMLMFGAVKKMLGLLQMDCRSSIRDMVIKILKLHGFAWQQYPCFRNELNEYLRLIHVDFSRIYPDPTRLLQELRQPRDAGNRGRDIRSFKP